MIYLTSMLGTPVVDASGTEIGTISDIAIATGEVFPRVTSLAFQGPDKTPFMLSWRKWVGSLDDDAVTLNADQPKIRFSYLQPDEVLLARDLLNKQIVDTHGKKVVRVNDLKLSEAQNELRLLGAEVGLRGILRGIHPQFERTLVAGARLVGRDIHETIIAWNYMDLLDRDLSHVQLSVTHRRLHELHPADVADILEVLSASQRAKVFAHLANDQAAEAISELEDDLQADVIDDLTDQRASNILEIMDPDDAADIIGDLPYDKAEALLHLMGVNESKAVRSLLGYKEKTAGGIMTPEVTTVTEDMTVQQVVDLLRSDSAEHEAVYYIYVVDDSRRLVGVISLRDLIVSSPETPIAEFTDHEVFKVGVDDDQEDVAEMMSKYDLLALPVVDENDALVGIVTVDDALEVMEEESAEDLALATGSMNRWTSSGPWSWLGQKSGWLVVWAVPGVGAALLLSAFSDSLTGFVSVVLFLPLVIRMSEDISSHSMAVMIDAGSADERPPFLRQLMIDMIAGVLLGAVSGLIALGVLEFIDRPLESAIAVAIAVGTTVVLMAGIGAVLPYLALKRDGSGWRAPSVLISTGVAVAGLAAYLAVATWLSDVVRF
ncbi:MAG: magnesium transporter [Actinomycetota bacterium]|nr:magnesium transporter [Actinomycetota bacterium]